MPKHSLFRLASSIYNTPHLITPQAFDVVLNYLDYRNKGIDLLMPDPLDTEEGDTDKPDSLEDVSESDMPVVVINVDGSLTYRPVSTMCGDVGTSYQQLEDDVEDAIEMGATTIVLNFSSGGGQADHCFETAINIRQMCSDANVSLIGYVDEMACSAAYAIACVADELYANPSATVGSIGCVVCLMDTSKAMDMAGYKRIFVTSGDNKVPFDAEGAFKESFLEEIQADVDKLNMQFSDHVSNYTGIDAKIIRDFQASCFDADKGLSNNLVTGIMTNKEFVQYIVSKQGVAND